MTHAGRGVGTVGFQMILLTFHIFEKSMTLRALDGGPVRNTRGIGQTKGATMRAGSTMVFDMAISYVTMIAIILVFSHGRHGDYGIVMLIIQ
jgi:hypothetical protein